MQVITRRQCAKNDVKCDLFQCDLFLIFDLTPSLSHILIPQRGGGALQAVSGKFSAAGSYTEIRRVESFSRATL